MSCAIIGFGKTGHARAKVLARNGIKLIDGAGHWVQEERPVRLSTLLLAFIEEGDGADHTGEQVTDS